VRDLEDVVAHFPDGALDLFLLGPAPLERNAHHAILSLEADLGDVIEAAYLALDGF
jgi:hypothetical protein